jgi:hypothetical protein
MFIRISTKMKYFLVSETDEQLLTAAATKSIPFTFHCTYLI